MPLRPKTFLFIAACLLVMQTTAQVDLVRHKYCVDSLEKQIAVRGDDSVKVDLLHRKAYHQYWIDTSAANAINEKAWGLAYTIKYAHGQFQYIYVKGNFAEYHQDYVNALVHYSNAAEWAERAGLIADRHDAYASLLNLYFYRGEYVYALDICHKGLRLAEENHDAVREANYTNLEGFIYRNMHQDKDSETSFKKYLKQAETLGDSQTLGSAYTEMTQVMIRKEKYDSAEVFAYQAYDYYDGIYNRHRRAFIHYLVAQIDLAKGLREAAGSNAHAAIEISRNAPSNEYDVARYYIIAGKALLQMRLPEDALCYLDTGLRISMRIHHSENIRDAYQLIAYSYDILEKHDSAYHYLSLFDELQDSLLNEENLRAIAEMNARFKLDSAQRDLKEAQEAEAENFRRTNFIIGIIVLIILMLFLVYNRYRLKQKAQLQLTINRQQNEMFQGILSAQEKERQRIASDLHDGLGSLLSSAKLQLSLINSADAKLSEDQQKHYTAALEMVSRSSEDLRSISHSIMPAPLTKLGLTAALENVIAGLASATPIKITFQSYSMEVRPSASIELPLYNITMELINNAIKHSAATELSIQLVGHPNHINLSVEDNGKGFDVQNVGNGIGLANIRSRVEFLKGTIEIDSSPGRGTIVSLDVPVS